MGSLSGGNSIIKYLVFIFNFLFFVIGCGMLGIGIWVKVAKPDYIDISEELSSVSKYATAGNMLIAIGVIITIVAFLGCCGAIQENACMLLVFFNFLLIIFILELAAGIYAYLKRDDLEKQLKKDFENAIKERYHSNNTVQKLIDEFQRKFECCGYTDYKDYQYSKFHNDTHKLPASCCKKGTNSTFCPTTDPLKGAKYYNQKGCFKEVVEFFKDNIYIVGSASIAFAVIQILGLVFSMMLYRALKSSGTLA